MSLLDCIKKASDAGIINKAKQTELEFDYQSLFDEYIEKGFSKEQAAKMAGLDTFDNLKYKAALKAKQTLITSRLQEETLEQFKNYKDIKGNVDYGSVIKQKFFSTETREGVSRIASLEEEMSITSGIIFDELTDVLLKYRRNLLGMNRNRATFLTLGREIFNPGSTGNKSAQELAEAWRKSAEVARRLFNEAGGSIPYLKKWHLPQHHNSSLVDEAGLETWKNFLKENNLLDLDNMLDHTTGKPFTKEKLDSVLDDVFETIASEGYNKNPKYNFSSNIANRRMDHRFLKFKDFDAWDAYNKRFGDGNVIDIMIGHLKSMSRDVALMRTLSPNPKNFLRWMEQTAKKELQQSKIEPKLKRKLKEKLKNDIVTANNGLKFFSGDLHNPVKRWMARGFAGLRELTTSMYLGSAFFMSLIDLLTTRKSAKFSGIPAMKMMFSNLKMFKEGYKQDKSTLIKIAMTSGMTADHFTTMLSGLNRQSIQETESFMGTKILADFVLRSSGLSWWTQAGRWGAGMETMAFLARNVDLTYSQIQKTNKEFFEMLKTHNITETDWNVIRSTKLYDAGIDDPKYKGALYLKPIDILDRTDLPNQVLTEVNRKLQRFVNHVVDFAVPNAKARGNVAVVGNTRPGTIMGETARNFVQFKQFPFTLHLTHVVRGWGRKTFSGKFGYLAPLFIQMTMGGLFAYELKQLVKGKDTSDISKMNKSELSTYITNGMLHGGGMGFIGDFLFSTQYGGGKGGVSSTFGAVPVFLFDALDLTFGNSIRFIRGEDPNIGGQISNFLKKNTPGGSLWYGRVAIERWLHDTISEWIDPKYLEKRKRLNNKVRRKENTKFWWKPGRKFPSRSPEF